MRSFCSAKASLMFSTKNISVFGYKVIRHLTSWPLNEFVKLTMLWTTGPRFWDFFVEKLLSISWISEECFSYFRQFWEGKIRSYSQIDMVNWFNYRYYWRSSRSTDRKFNPTPNLFWGSLNRGRPPTCNNSFTTDWHFCCLITRRSKVS